MENLEARSPGYIVPTGITAFGFQVGNPQEADRFEGLIGDVWVATPFEQTTCL